LWKKKKPSKTFDLGWKYGEMAYSKCNKRGIPEIRKNCGRLQEIVEDAFDEQGMALQEAFGHSYSQAIEVSSRPAFAKLGEKTLDDTIDWMIKEKISDYETLKGYYIQKFFKWFAEVLKEVDQPGSGLANELPEGINFDNIPQPPRSEL